MGKFKGTWIDVARETMTETQVYALMAGLEQEIQDDPDCAPERADSIVQRHYPNVVIVAWDGDNAVVSGTEQVERALEILSISKRFDERLALLRAHLKTGASEAWHPCCAGVVHS